MRPFCLLVHSLTSIKSKSFHYLVLFLIEIVLRKYSLTHIKFGAKMKTFGKNGKKESADAPTISSAKVAELIERLLYMYGRNGEQCSYNHLARIFNPESPPKNAIGEWLRQERLPNQYYIARLAELSNLTVPQLERLLTTEENEDEDELVHKLYYDDSDLRRCEALLCKISTGQEVDENEVVAVTDIIHHLSVDRLKKLHSNMHEKLNNIVRKKKDARLSMIYYLYSQVEETLLTDLESLTSR